MTNLRTIGQLGEEKRAQGLIAETMPREMLRDATIMVGGTVYATRIFLHAGDVITNISQLITVAGATMTLGKVGLYSKAGVRLAVSANQTTAWESTGVKTVALTAPYEVLTSDDYYVVIVAAGATLPTLLAGGNLAAAAVPVAAGIRPYATEAGQTDLDATLTLVATAAIAFWHGLS